MKGPSRPLRQCSLVRLAVHHYRYKYSMSHIRLTYVYHDQIPFIRDSICHCRLNQSLGNACSNVQVGSYAPDIVDTVDIVPSTGKDVGACLWLIYKCMVKRIS